MFPPLVLPHALQLAVQQVDVMHVCMTHHLTVTIWYLFRSLTVLAHQQQRQLQCLPTTPLLLGQGK